MIHSVDDNTHYRAFKGGNCISRNKAFFVVCALFFFTFYIRHIIVILFELKFHTFHEFKFLWQIFHKLCLIYDCFQSFYFKPMIKHNHENLFNGCVKYLWDVTLHAIKIALNLCVIFLIGIWSNYNKVFLAHLSQNSLNIFKFPKH